MNGKKLNLDESVLDLTLNSFYNKRMPCQPELVPTELKNIMFECAISISDISDSESNCIDFCDDISDDTTPFKKMRIDHCDVMVLNKVLYLGYQLMIWKMMILNQM